MEASYSEVGVLIELSFGKKFPQNFQDHLSKHKTIFRSVNMQIEHIGDRHRIPFIAILGAPSKSE